MSRPDSTTWDYFVSFTAVDEEWARWIADVLEAAAYRVIWQGGRFVVGTRWPTLMRQAVVGSRTTIAVLSPAYERSRGAMVEWRLAQDEGDGRLFPVLVADPPTNSSTWDADISPHVWLDLRGVGRADARERLLDALDDTRWGRRQTGEPRTNALPDRTGSRLPRTELLLGISRALRPVGPGQSAVVVVSGVPGIGKSTLAAAFAAEHAADYRIVWWVDASSVTVARARLAELAHDLGLQDQASEASPLERVLRGLAARHRWLLVFDGVDSDFAEIEKLLPRRSESPCGPGHVLVTTRSHRRLLPGVAGVVDVPPLDPEESLELLRRGFSGSAGHYADREEAACRRLAELLDGLPLALAQAIRRTDSAVEYLADLEAYRSELLDADVVPEYGTSVGAVVRVALAALSEPSAMLLRVLAALGSGPVPIELLLATADELDPVLGHAAASAIRLKPALDPLTDRGLARRHTDQVTGRRSLAVHAVIRTVQADVAAASGLWGDAVRTATRMIDTIVGSSTEDTAAARTWWTCLLPLALTVVEYSSARREVLEGDALPPAVTILNGSAAYLRWCGDPEQAVVLSRAALAVAEAYVAETHVEGTGSAEVGRAVAGCRHRLAEELVAGGRPDDAVDVLEPVLIDWERVLGPSPVVAGALLTKAAALAAQRRYESAEVALRRAIDLVTALYGVRSPELAPYLTDLAVLDAVQHRPGAGLRTLAEIDALEPTGEADVRQTARRSEIRAVLFWELGRHAEAVETFQRAAELARAAYGGGHPAALAAQRNTERAVRRLSGNENGNE